MYDRYFQGDGFEAFFPQAAQMPPPPPSSAPESQAHPENQPPRKSGLLGSLGQRLKLPELDSDTILLLVLVYFLLADTDENGEKSNLADTLLIVGALLLLGF